MLTLQLPWKIKLHDLCIICLVVFKSVSSVLYIVQSILCCPIVQEMTWCGSFSYALCVGDPLGYCLILQGIRSVELLYNDCIFTDKLLHRQ